MSMKTHIEDLYEFLNLSSTSFRSGVKEKPKEQRLRLRGQKVYFSPCFPVSFTSETDIWAQVGSTYVAVFSAPFRLDPMALILFDNSCKVMTRKQRSRVKLKRHRTSVYSHFRNFEFEYHSEKDEIEWYQRIHSSIDQCSWSKLHRYQSFAPIRPHCLASWYVDASDYFEAVYNAILSAKDVIFLAGWWISPELYLRRPPPDHENSRLDRLLKKKAEEGVLIYVLLYKEVTLALPINSLYSKTRLRSLHPNMKVFRHPDARPLPIPWAHHEKLVVIDYTTAFIGGIDLCFGRYDSHNHPVMDSFPEIWPGQDYSNPRVADFRDVDEYHKQLIDKRNTPRMGWHDISVCVQGSMDVAWHFIQRWNHCKMDKAPDKEIFPLIIPPDDLSKDVEKNGKSCTAQVLRSVGFWSSGSLTEPSIANAYLNLIENSERFLYIENQFFVTASGATNYVRNRIGEAIYQRIVKAYQKNQNFKVIILIPLLPAFENPVDAATAGTIRLVMNFQYESISRGTKSLLGRLKEVGIPHEKYIGFFSLRSFSPLMRTRSAVDIHKGANPNEVVDFVTEQTYVHSKLMIVDDRYVIVGSANLNDRSLLGDRDSEVGVVIEDNQKISIQTNGETIEVCEFAHSLRVRLFREHLGLLSSNVSPSWNQDGQELVNQLLNDPSSNEFFEKIWCDTADKNTAIFREVFSAVPDDTVTSWDEYYQFKNPNTHRTALNLPMDAISEKLSKIRGRLVRFPIRFLEKEALGASTFSRENLVPVDVFV
ncbi:hypothetical protein BKA69DRAFT_1060232 [Paraphysoderma sedebokerense]|nr:hypothetical protein BKA69DRAFT_1060107 [Paraphysoderma sedebokerense]KAI9143577.1 hypothetical protein BKA69DRAFT_1060232 [Paraphysoderma sedebokerense]